MKIWLDALTPKQLLFFNSFKNRIKNRKKVKIWFTSRNYEQVTPLIKILGLEKEIEIIGSFGGKTLEGKLSASIERMNKLKNRVFEEKPDIAISSGSIEASRIAYGLSIPHICISDSPHSPIYPLSLPISKILFTPWIIPKKEWIIHGIRKEKIFYYKALDPVAWLIDFLPNKSILENIGIDYNEPYILIRPPEVHASYLLNINNPYSLLFHLLKKLPKIFPDFKIVIMNRYIDQAKFFKNLGKKFILLNKVIEGTSLIFYSSLVISGGGTITQEAALLGIPTISIYPGKLPIVIDFLKKKKLIYHIYSQKDIKYIYEISNNFDIIKEKQKLLSKYLWKKMEDPIPKIIKEINKLF